VPWARKSLIVRKPAEEAESMMQLPHSVELPEEEDQRATIGELKCTMPFLQVLKYDRYY
jgi:hypothetical protein